MVPMHNWYEVLGVPERVTVAELKRELALAREAHHPDKFVSASPDVRAWHAARLDTYLRGVDYLLNERSRNKLDEHLERQRAVIDEAENAAAEAARAAADAKAKREQNADAAKKHGDADDLRARFGTGTSRSQSTSGKRSQTTGASGPNTRRGPATGRGPTPGPNGPRPRGPTPAPGSSPPTGGQTSPPKGPSNQSTPRARPRPPDLYLTPAVIRWQLRVGGQLPQATTICVHNRGSAAAHPSPDRSRGAFWAMSPDRVRLTGDLVGAYRVWPSMAVGMIAAGRYEEEVTFGSDGQRTILRMVLIVSPTPSPRQTPPPRHPPPSSHPLASSPSVLSQLACNVAVLFAALAFLAGPFVVMGPLGGADYMNSQSNASSKSVLGVIVAILMPFVIGWGCFAWFIAGLVAVVSALGNLLNPTSYKT